MIDLSNLQTIIKERDIIKFSETALGMPLHAGHIYWFKNSTKIVNILKPANQWGKTTAEAIKHIFQAVCKPQLDHFNPNFQTWFDLRYPTLNFGKTYEIAKGVMEAIIDITEGRYLLPDGSFNKSILEGWAIRKITDTPKLPSIVWFNNSVNLIRSYDDLGSSFKRLKLAFVSGDECGDIPELQLFLTGTLMPRVLFFKGCIDLVGTSQPKGVEYEEIAEIAEKDMIDNGVEGAEYFVLSANSNQEMATVYVNTFMSKEAIQKIESIADPELRKQIIYGQYVDWSEHLYSFDEVSKMFQNQLPWDSQTGITEEPRQNAYYVFSVDVAATNDETSLTGIRYNRKLKLPDGSFKPMKHRVVFHKAWKGNTMPLTLQYELVMEYVNKYKLVSPMRTKFVYDAAALGGKNAEQAFSKLHGSPFPPKHISALVAKAEGMGKMKEILGRGRKFYTNSKGEVVDIEPDWGGIEASPKLKELRRQLENASLKDEKLKNDQFMSLMQGVHYIEARAPKNTHVRAISFNLHKALLT